jgi:uncharacterized OsmC-like protein
MSKGEINGVDTAHLLFARGVVGDTPAAGEYTWRASNEWVHGTHSRTTIGGYFGLGEERDHKGTYEFEADHPLEFNAGDNAATPVEIVLAGLASCLTAGVAAVAENREIKLRSVKATLEADMNIGGILGSDPEVRNGFNDVRVNYEIDADDTSESDLEALVAQSQKISAVFDIMTNPTNVTVSVN